MRGRGFLLLAAVLAKPCFRDGWPCLKPARPWKPNSGCLKRPDDPRSYITPVESIFVEWDRNLIWAMANSGMYLLTSDALGTPQFDLAGIAGN